MRKILIIMIVGALVGFHMKQELFQTTDGAIKGYDVVAYFTESKAIKGKKEWSTVWNEATWYFSKKSHLEAFLVKPEQYAPQYDGFCAYGVSKGAKYSIDPTAWKIVDGKLYLNYNQKTHQSWLQEKHSLIKLADSKWPEVKEQ